MSDKYPGGFVTANAPAGFSVAFDGTGDYLNLTPTTALQLANNNFTIEMWVNFSVVSATRVLNNYGYEGNGNKSFIIYYDSSTLHFGYSPDGTASTDVSLGAFVPVANTWYHIAVVRNSTTVTGYVNGTALSAPLTIGTNTIYYPATSAAFRIGVDSTNYLNGYISNYRLVKGTAVYTTTFTPPTQLFPITNTSLLTCQSPTIIDNSTNAFTITANGDAKVSNFTPFAAYQGFNPALGAAAGGVWTLDEAAYYQNNRIWPIYDPYFNQTTLMLHGNGTNAAQNNTFLDSSTNNFTITRSGNTTQGTFSPFSQTGWSVSNTISQYCQLNNADYSFSTGDFTVELWMYCVDDSTYSATNICSAPSNPNFTVGFGSGSAGARQLYVEYGGGATTGIGSSMSGYLNKWTHIAVVRQSGIVTAYQNGVSLGSVSKAAAVGSTANLYLLRNSGDTGQDFRGYVSNLRISKSAVYTSNFTPSTTPLNVIANTLLLTFQSNRFVDNSALNTTVTPTATTIQAFSPFVPAYITPTTYSNFFDGSGDYLTVPNNAAFNFGSGDATIEAWIYPTTSGQTSGIFDKRSSGANYSQFPQVALSSGALVILVSYSGSSWAVTINGATPTVNAWTHVAVVRNGNIWTLYVNGIVSGTPVTASGSVYASTDSLSICAATSGGLNPFTGVVSNLRIVKGTALYTANFTPPTAPLTNITNTSLLTCQSSTFIDNSSNNFTITATGNVQPVTSPTPFPAKVDTTTLNAAYSTSLIGGSAYFDGTGDYLLNTTNSVQIASSTNFTVEFFVYNLVSSTAGQGKCIFAIGTEAADRIQFTLYGAEVRVEIYAGTLDYRGGSVPLNAWAHVAIVRSGSTMTTYVNGASVATATYSAVLGNTGGFIIGSNRSISDYYNGFISGLRLINGTARYTSNFAPPIAPPTPVTNTQLLLNYTNAGIIDNTAKNVLETVGNAQISTTQSKWGGTSMSCPATNGNYFVAPPNQPNLLFNTGQFTIELWAYPTAFTNTAAGLVGYGVSGGYTDWNLEINTSGTVLYIDNETGRFSSSSNLSTNTWTHIAVSRTNTAVTLYFNGISVGTYATINNISGSSTSARLYVGTGAQVPASRQFIGFIDDLRITKGVARYTTTFTPPTSQLQDQ